MAPIHLPLILSPLISRTLNEDKTRKPLIESVAIGLGVLSFVIGVMRLGIRMKRRTTSWEDGFIAVAMVSFCVLQTWFTGLICSQLFSILESTVACLGMPTWPFVQSIT